MKANHIARNASIKFLGNKYELFFQAINCDHIADNYRGFFSSHDVKFVEIVNLLKGDIWVQNTKQTNKYKIISKYKGKYYRTIVTLSERIDLNKAFIVVISCYICNDKTEQNAYETYTIENKKRYR